MKICTHCNKEKDEKEFSFSDKKRGYLKSRCKECISAIEKELMPWKKRIKFKNFKETYVKKYLDKREASLYYSYGIKYKEYFEMVKNQNEKCAICGTVPKMLVVDHCHSSGNVRGLLCSKCNSGLGMLGDTAESLKKAYEYLIK